MALDVATIDRTDQPTLDAAYRIAATVEAMESPDLPPPCRRRFEAPLWHPMPGIDTRWSVARLDGVPVGWVRVNLHLLDNTDNANIELAVDPAYRRRGVGRALFAHARLLLRRAGCKRVVGAAVTALPDDPCDATPAWPDGHASAGAGREFPGGAFAAALGARPVLVEVRRRLDVTALDRTRLAALRAGARSAAAGYRTVRWHGHPPSEHLTDLAHLEGRLMTDAPLGDLEWEPERMDAERMQGMEQALDARGVRRYSVAAVHGASGRLVAWSVLSLAANTTRHAWQQITIVDPAHRGHRLGLLCKAENLEHTLAYEPELSVVDTYNAALNTHMIAINEQLGFRPVAGATEWQATI
ncbi:GNAT family N-acetyltransferase [Micromonospora sp. HUAS LYJ1]|uniref:GNAT family N-acetyltransferase n=1 Tax=Micromonospora sp. HUAS LYJ1 TaxID=3061626 RepID=UPI0026720EA9|nr:GNAT family N-acetyltransferase [Micromonospora sp. HUAS LYJ1]WKU02686.1 GNAT family N-acetyltransferase [Micromonospora sp. HUAS LYJ1]